MSRTMDDKEDKDNNNKNEQNLRESSLSSLPSSSLSLLEPSLSSTSTTTTTTTTCTPFGFNRSVDSYSSNIMGRKNFKPESVSCLTQKQPVSLTTTVNQLDNQSNERIIKMKQFQSSSSLPTATVTSTCSTYHPHHYHHHRHHDHQDQSMTPSSTQYKSSSYYHYKHDDNKNDETKIEKEDVNILHKPTPTPTSTSTKTSQLPQSTISSTVRNSSCSVNSIGDYSVSMRKSDNSNPLGLPNWSQNQQQSLSSSSNINNSLIKKVTNPVDGSIYKVNETPLSSSPSLSSSSKVTDPITSHHPTRYHNYRHHHHYHHTHLHSPRKSKRILSTSSSRWLHRSASDPGMASSATYSTHTSALLLTTGAYSGSPSLLASSQSPSSSPTPPSSSVITTTTLRNKSYSPICISPTSVTTKVITKTTTNPSSLSPSPTPPCYFVPSSSSNASLSTTTPTPPPRTRHLTGLPSSPSPPPSTPHTSGGFNKQQQQSSTIRVNPSPSPSPPPPHHHHQAPKQLSPSQPNLASLSTTSGASSASQFFSSQMSNTKRCVLRLDGYSYLIVANPPETKVTKDAHESSETIVARRGIQKTTVPSSISSSSPWNTKDKDNSSSIVDKIDTSSILKESTMETLPPVDTVEACDKAASRLRELAQHLDHGEVPISILKKTLQYAACVLDTVTMDETRKWRPGLVRKKGLGARAPSDPTPSPLTKSLSICGPVPITNQSSSLLAAKSTTSSSTVTITSSSLEMSSDLRSLSINKTIPTSTISRKILDEEDDLSEVQPDAVPNEVREWLASTFTRNNTAQKRRSEEKPKFRSVANAIRAGIMVDRLYRRLCCSNMVQIPPKIADRLKSIDSWSYDCFKLNEASNNQVLKYISYELLNRYGLVHKFKIPLETLESCLTQFEQGYTKFKNPYHNNIHAADVTQTVHYMLSKMGLVNWLTDLEIFATLLAAIIHDFQHTGTTNNFHVMSESETALLYNDRAVLENFHVSAAFRILRENDCNILVNLNKEEYRELRTLVIDMVLATDMSSHFQQIKTMKSLLSNANEFTVDKSKALSLVLHCCDISHPSKQWDIHRRWTELLLEEFFRQGDKERELGLPYSPLCDRNTTLVAESQIGFIDFIVAPSLEVCGDLLDKIYQQLEGCRHSSGSSEESLEERLPDNGTRPKSLSTYKNKRSGLSVDSAESPVNSRPVASAPASPRFSHCTSFGNCKAEGGRLKRPWSDNLEENRKKWQERAAIDAIQREQNARKQTTDGICLSMSPESEL